MNSFPPALGYRSSKRHHRLVVIDGPNMSNLGARNKRVYGSISSLEDLQNFCKDFASSLGVTVTTFASNYEGAILEFIHGSAQTADAYIINPAGVRSRRNPATRSRHIPATWCGAQGHLEGSCERRYFAVVSESFWGLFSRRFAMPVLDAGATFGSR